LPLAVLGAACSLILCSASPAKRPGAAGYTLVESATLVQPGNQSATAAETTSTGDPFTWGAVDLPIPPRLKLSQLTSLSTDYKFVQGSCGGGSPRFEAWVTNGTDTWKIFFYIGPAPNYTGCPSGVYANTGNLATADSLVDDSALGGSPYDKYSTVQARFGRYAVTHVYADLDGGWSSDQTVDFDNTRVNDGLTTYEG
jgi:hypothetical protein